MNLKKILCIAVIVSASSHAFALEIYKGKIISQKTWSTDGGKAVMVANKSQVRKQPRMDTSYQYVEARVYAGTAKVGEPVTIAHDHGYGVGNNDTENHTYQARMTVCSSESANTVHCIHHFDTIELTPGGYFREDNIPDLVMTYDKAGSYYLSAYTSLSEDKVNTDNYGPTGSVSQAIMNVS